MNPAWARVKLRVAWGDVPEFGDELVLPTGRRYQVIDIRGKTLHCLVLPASEPITGRVVPWQWAPRRRRARAR